MPSSACDWSSDVCSSDRSEEHTSELQSRSDLVCRLLLEKKKNTSELQTRAGPACAWLLRNTGLDLTHRHQQRCLRLRPCGDEITAVPHPQLSISSNTTY